MLSVSVFTVYLESIPWTEEDEFCLLVLFAISVLWGQMPSMFLALYKVFSCIRDFPADVVIFILVCNIMWRYGVIHNMLHLRGLTMSRVSTHTAKLWCFSTPKAAFTDGVKFFFFKKSLLRSRTRCYLNILSAKTFETCLLDYKDKAALKPDVKKQLAEKVNFYHFKIQIPHRLMKIYLAHHYTDNVGL